MRMRFLAGLSASFLGAGAATAQSTFCYPVGRGVSCQTTPAPAANQQLQQGMSQFGSALGYAIAERKARALQAKIGKQVVALVAAHDCTGALVTAAPLNNAALNDEIVKVCVPVSAAPPAAAPQVAEQPVDDKAARAMVDAFAGDPRHPYFGLEREEMRRLIDAGAAQTLQQAYDLAVAKDPRLGTLNPQPKP